MDHNPDDKVGDDYPEDRPSNDGGAGQTFPFLPPATDKTLKKVFGLDDAEETEPPENPHRQEPNNKPS